MKKLHLGKLIHRQFSGTGMTEKELAGKTGLSVSRLQSIFQQHSMDAELVARFCKALEYDFFQACYPSPRAVHIKTATKSIPAKANLILKFEIEVTGKLSKKQVLESVSLELDRWLRD